MHPNYYKQMDSLAAWMKHSGESLIGADPTPGSQLSNVRITTRDNHWYLHLLPSFTRDVSVKTDRKPTEIRLLRTGEAIPYLYRDGFLTFMVDPAKRTTMDDVVKITF